LDAFGPGPRPGANPASAAVRLGVKALVAVLTWPTSDRARLELVKVYRRQRKAATRTPGDPTAASRLVLAAFRRVVTRAEARASGVVRTLLAKDAPAPPPPPQDTAAESPGGHAAGPPPGHA